MLIFQLNLIKKFFNKFFSINFLKENELSIILITYFYCYIAGPALVNIFTVLLAIYAITYIGIRKRTFNTIEIILSIFFLYITLKEIFFSSSFNYDLFGLIRFYLIFLLIPKFINQKLNIFNVLLFTCLFISIDGIYQYYFFYDFFGFQKFSVNRITGVFDDEPIIGSFLLRFYFPIVFYFMISKKNNSLYSISYLVIAYCIFISGEKMALIQLVFTSISIVLYLILFKSHSFKFIRHINFKYLVLLIFLLATFLFHNENYKTNRFYHLYDHLTNYDYSNLQNNINSKTSLNDYVYNFASAIELFKEKPIFGNGYRDYNLNCKEKLSNSYLSFGCSTHPHNITLEMLTDHGVVGISLFYFFIIFLIYKNFSLPIKYYGFLITLIILNFPIFTSQSIFSSYYGSSYFFIIYLNYFFYLKNSK